MEDVTSSSSLYLYCHEFMFASMPHEIARDHRLMIKLNVMVKIYEQFIHKTISPA